MLPGQGSDEPHLNPKVRNDHREWEPAGRLCVTSGSIEFESNVAAKEIRCWFVDSKNHETPYAG